MRSRLNEIVLPTDRWSNRAVSPLKFQSKSDRAKPTVIIHPGWGKRPEIHSKLMNELAEAGMMPIGVDTRFGYANRYTDVGYKVGSSAVSLFNQYYRTGIENPFFDAKTETDNRYRLRRPTGLAALCQSLDIEDASLVGHSEGGRVVATLTAESDVLDVPKLVVVNSVGTGDSSNGLRRMFRSNIHSNYVLNGTVDLAQGVISAAESTAYCITHPRRFWREREVIQNTDIWPLLGEAAYNGTEVTRVHAIDDELIDYGNPSQVLAEWPNITFIPTVGGHSNVYTPEVRSLILNILAA